MNSKVKSSGSLLTTPKYRAPASGAIARARRFLPVRALTLLLILLMSSGSSFGYSVLTHEQIVDLLWGDEIQPLLLQRYPLLSEDQLREAHAYAYGGAVIQDLGYYPFGSREFSSLVHYVRSGAERRADPRGSGSGLVSFRC